MMNKTELSNNIINALSNIDNHSDAMTKLLDTIKKYIEDKCILSYSWAAFNAKGDKDPLTSFDCSVKSTPNPVVDLSQCKSATDALITLGSILTTWILTFTILPKVTTLIVTPIKFIETITLTPSNADNQKDAMEHLADEIISGIRSCTPTSGSNSAFTGAGVFTSFK